MTNRPFRMFDFDRDMKPVQRIWQECGWIDDDESELAAMEQRLRDLPARERDAKAVERTHVRIPGIVYGLRTKEFLVESIHGSFFVGSINTKNDADL